MFNQEPEENNQLATIEQDDSQHTMPLMSAINGTDGNADDDALILEEADESRRLAVQSALLTDSGLGEPEIDEALVLVGEVIEAHHAGTIDANALSGQLALLDGDPGEGVLLTNDFDAEQARAWIDGLRGLLQR